MTVRNVSYANGFVVRTRFLTGWYLRNKKHRKKFQKKKIQTQMHQNTDTKKKISLYHHTTCICIYLRNNGSARLLFITIGRRHNNIVLYIGTLYCISSAKNGARPSTAAVAVPFCLRPRFKI